MSTRNVRSVTGAFPQAMAVLLLVLACSLWGPAGVEAGDLQTDGRLVSTVAPGTPPLAVSSSDKVDNLNADLIDGFDSASFRFDNVIRVGKEGTGDFESIQAAIDSIPIDLAGYPTSLILVGPGVWEEQVRVSAGVLLRGSGRDLTSIQFLGGSRFDDSSTTVKLLYGALGIEDVQVWAGSGAGGIDYAIGILNEAYDARIRGVKVQMFSAGVAEVGVLSRERLSIDGSEIFGSNGAPFTAGVWNEAPLRVTRSHLQGATALFNTSNSPDEHFSVYVDYTEINGNRDNAVVDDDEFDTYLRHSILTYNSGAVDDRVTCLGVIKAPNFYQTTCP